MAKNLSYLSISHLNPSAPTRRRRRATIIILSSPPSPPRPSLHPPPNLINKNLLAPPLHARIVHLRQLLQFHQRHPHRGRHALAVYQVDVQGLREARIAEGGDIPWKVHSVIVVGRTAAFLVVVFFLVAVLAAQTGNVLEIFGVEAASFDGGFSGLAGQYLMEEEVDVIGNGVKVFGEDEWRALVAPFGQDLLRAIGGDG